MAKFTVRFSETTTRTGSAEIEAQDEEEAREKAEELGAGEIDWDDEADHEREPGREITDVEPEDWDGVTWICDTCGSGYCLESSAIACCGGTASPED